VQDDELFEDHGGVLVPRSGPVAHNAEEYDPRQFAVLLHMQREHFWYRGRHRFVRAAVEKHLSTRAAGTAGLSAIDLGGGCGGWVNYLDEHGPSFGELAMGDSSPEALRLARQAVPESVRCYNVSIYDLPWTRRWDVVFVLDVIEHLADDAAALRQIARALKPGGLIVASVPALMAFWSYTDVVGGHHRRYSCDDLNALGARAGLEVLDARYFMFLLSPMLWASRKRAPRPETQTAEQLRKLAEESHQVPSPPVNALLGAVFGSETPLGLNVRFPWGTSALAVFRNGSE
jgi:SAM-dependent methyltransferase